MTRITRMIIPLAALTAATALAEAEDAQITEVGSLSQISPAQLKPNIIVFTDHRKDELVDQATGLIRFEDWDARTSIAEKTA